MTTSIEKYKLENKVVVAFYKHRGDVDSIAKELDVDVAYIKKVTDKLKRGMRKDVSQHVAVAIMETIHVGYQQRVRHSTECLNSLRSEAEADVSYCCNACVIEKEEGGQIVVKCLKCKLTTHIHHIHRPHIYKLIQEFGRELREEDKQLLEFADKMGFTLRDNTPSNIIRQNFVVLGNQKPAKSAELSDGDKQIVKEIEAMSPMERQRTRRRLEAKIIEDEGAEDVK